jgi:hypothetical protein
MTDDLKRDRQAAEFRRTVWVQVYLPLLAGVILAAVLVGMGLAASGRGGGTTSGMADTALVALLLPGLLLGVIGLVAIILLAVGVGRVIGWIPERTRTVQRIAEQVARQSDQIASRVTPVIVVPKSAWGALVALWARLAGRG